MAPAPSDGQDDFPPPGVASPISSSHDDKKSSSAFSSAVPTPSLSSMAVNFPIKSWTAISTFTQADGNVVVSGFGSSTTVASVSISSSSNSASATPHTTSAYSDYQPPLNPSTTTADGSSQHPSNSASLDNEVHRAPVPAIVAMGIIIPLILIGLSALACFFCIRRRRREHGATEVEAMRGGTAAPQMKSVGVGGGLTTNAQSERAYMASPTTAAATAAVLSPASTSSSTTPIAPQPVILSTTMNNGFYTGIDTSDHISLTDQRSQASAETFGEEPPPPYRPRSVPPMSRESSVRQPMAGMNACPRSSRHDPLSGAGLIRRSDEVRSPFDDPESSDDDAISQISTIRSYRNRPGDALSVVSDISYQEDEGTHSSHTRLAGSQPI